MIRSTDLCVINLGGGERVSGELAQLLDLADMGSMHEYRLPANSDVELHFHDFDEYWLFHDGHPSVTLSLPDGSTHTYDLGPGYLVATLRVVAHTLQADHMVSYYQWNGTIRDTARQGHLVREAIGDIR